MGVRVIAVADRHDVDVDAVAEIDADIVRLTAHSKTVDVFNAALDRVQIDWLLERRFRLVSAGGDEEVAR